MQSQHNHPLLVYQIPQSCASMIQVLPEKPSNIVNPKSYILTGSYQLGLKWP